MNLREMGRFAWRGVTANKTRSGLTTLGILIGVAAVIILVAVGTGSSRAVQDQISALGSNTLTVSSTSSSGGGFGPGGGAGGPGGSSQPTSQNATSTRAPELTMSDARAIATSEDASHVLGVAPVVSASSVTATYDGAEHSVSTFTGTTPAYLLIDNTAVTDGRSFTDAEYEAHARVALLGASVAEDLIGSDTSKLVGRCRSTVSPSPSSASSRRRAAWVPTTRTTE